MSQLTTVSTAKNDVILMIDSSPKLADSTKAQYTKAIVNYLDAGNNLGDAAQLASYADDLNNSSRAFLKSAVRLWTKRLASDVKATATPENEAAVTATLYRLDALNDAIQVPESKGQKAHTWLSQAEVKKLLATANPNTVKGLRNKVLIGLLVAAGLRREELANLKFDDVVQQPNGSRPRTVLNVTGKGAKDRIVPLSYKLAAALNEWSDRCGGEGYVARSVSRGGRIGTRISAIGIFKMVRAAGEDIDKPDLAPHDLRRTYAQLGFEAGVPITQISTLLGHANIATTQKYLNLDVDFDTTVSDFVPFD